MFCSAVACPLTARSSPIIFRDHFPNRIAEILKVAVKDDYLLDTLVDLGYVSRDQVASVQPDADSTGEGIIDLMLTRQMIPSSAVTQAKAAYFHAEVVN